MHIIPVLDVKGGRVVRARMGERENYFPIKTPLSPTADIFDVAAGLLSIYPFPTVYIADLDAIEGKRPPLHLVNQLRDAFTQSEIWLDAGLATRGAVEEMLANDRIVPVIGSESQRDPDLVQTFDRGSPFVLSLDLRESFLGHASIFEEDQQWPVRIIVMTLGRVGANAGPDFNRLREIKQRAKSRAVYAAGVIRDQGDLEQLAAMEIEGALVATSLHNGALTPKVVASFMKGA